MLGCNWDLGFLRVFLCTILFSLIIVKSLQLRGRRQIAEPRKYCLVRVIVFFDVCFLYLFCFSQVEILIKFPTDVLWAFKVYILTGCSKIVMQTESKKKQSLILG